MRIKFWGVRGSTPTPERRNSRYGGNTSCVEVTLADGTLIILDCGSGLRSLGRSLLRRNGKQPLRAAIFLTHFHWDHIQGIPFFAPLYAPGNVFQFHSVQHRELELKAAIEGQMSNPYFPVDMSVMRSQRYFRELNAHPVTVGRAEISWAELNHPQGCIGFRVEADDAVFAYATDTEPGSPVHDRNVRQLARNADVFVYDAQYTPEQLRGEKKGWGHSTYEEGARIALECGARRLVMFHHDPDHDDAYMDRLVLRAQSVYANTLAAAEGLTLKIARGNVEVAAVSGVAAESEGNGDGDAAHAALPRGNGTKRGQNAPAVSLVSR